MKLLTLDGDRSQRRKDRSNKRRVIPNPIVEEAEKGPTPTKCSQTAKGKTN
jgi:hypothetical protein